MDDARESELAAQAAARSRLEAAFPTHTACENQPGMTLRDWFAGQALAGLIASNDPQAGDRLSELPGYAYSIADEMLEARKR